MIAGYPPFYDENPFGIYQKILAGKIEFSKNHFDEASKSLISKLLVQDFSKRLGCLTGKSEDVKRHKFFKTIDWSAMLARQVPSPYTPPVRSVDDSSMFDKYPESDGASIPSVSVKDQAAFDNF